MTTRTLTAEDQVSLGPLFPEVILWTPEDHLHLCLWPGDLLPLPYREKGSGGRGSGGGRGGGGGERGGWGGLL